MPLGDRHRQQRHKNLLLGGALAVFVVLLFAVSLLKNTLH